MLMGSCPRCAESDSDALRIYVEHATYYGHLGDGDDDGADAERLYVVHDKFRVRELLNLVSVENLKQSLCEECDWTNRKL